MCVRERRPYCAELLPSYGGEKKQKNIGEFVHKTWPQPEKNTQQIICHVKLLAPQRAEAAG